MRTYNCGEGPFNFTIRYLSVSEVWLNVFMNDWSLDNRAGRHFFKEHRCMHAHIITNICTVSNMLDLNQLKANTNISWELLWSSISFFLNGPWGNALTGSSSNIFNKSTAKRGNIRLKGCIRKWEQNLGCRSPKDRNKKGNTFSKRRQWCLVNSGYILILW